VEQGTDADFAPGGRWSGVLNGADPASDLRPLINLVRTNPARAVGQALPFMASGAVQNADTIAGAAQGGWDAATETIPIGRHGVTVSVPKPVAGGLTGAALARMLGVPTVLGGAVGGAYPIVEGIIRGARGLPEDAAARPVVPAPPVGPPQGWTQVPPPTPPRVVPPPPITPMGYVEMLRQLFQQSNGGPPQP
jgi:hypothetical protein